MIRLLLTFLCLASLSAMEEGLKIRIPQAEQTVRVSIEEEANIRAEDRLQPLAKIKENTLAAALPDTGKDYVWIPGWDLTGTGALRVADAAAVLDGSVAAFLETVGKCEEAQGGRIILLDVLRKRIAGYFTVGRKLSALRLGNTLEYAVAFAEAQPVLKQPAGFVVLDLKEGKERSFHRTDKPVSFAVVGASLFFADAKGAGLAAPQVGKNIRVFIVDTDDGYYEFINPKILGTSGSQYGIEGCLSVKGKWGDVKRPRKVTVEALDRNGKKFKVVARDFFARAVCHENDHLDGILYVEKANNLRDDA